MWARKTALKLTLEDRHPRVHNWLLCRLSKIYRKKLISSIKYALQTFCENLEKHIPRALILHFIRTKAIVFIKLIVAICVVAAGRVKTEMKLQFFGLPSRLPAREILLGCKLVA